MDGALRSPVIARENVKQSVPFGLWPSPLSAMAAAAGSARLGDLTAWRGRAVWTEGRPAEGGRSVIVADTAQGPRDVLPAPYSARSKVHEYGGGALITGDGRLLFVNSDDQDIYEIADGDIVRITDAPDHRFADGVLDPGGTIIAVAERDRGGRHPENLLVAVGGDGGVRPLVRGQDFYAAPRLSPDGGQIAWLAWNLPDMPWQGAVLWQGRWDGTRVGDARPLTAAGEIAFQPMWSAGGILHAVIERDGESAVWRCADDGWERASTLSGEWLRPLWSLGERSYWLRGEAVGGLVMEVGAPVLAWPGRKERAAPGGDIAALANPLLAGDAVVAIAHHHHAAPAVVVLDPSGETRRLSGAGPAPAEGLVSIGQPVVAERAGGRVHALYYPPCNSGCRGPAGEAPPMIVSAHGGPTGQADRGLKFKIQFWTSRGFAFLDVDYRGSTGYGAAYRGALDGEWGIADADDLAAAALEMAARGLADPARLLASGSSAGGYSVLQALVRHDCFAAGTSIYGIGDPQALMRTTHKFEAGYFDRLFGLQGGADIQAGRIPQLNAGAISCPMLFLQGTEDRVVPPEQSRAMAGVLKAAGRRVALRMFEGEAHGFRRAETVSAALQTEHAFYLEVLGMGAPAAWRAVAPHWI